jgi:hypothetical protein
MKSDFNMGIRNQNISSSYSDPYIIHKMEVYHKSNPLNPILEHCESESKTSVLQDSQSLNKLSYSKTETKMR